MEKKLTDKTLNRISAWEARMMTAITKAVKGAYLQFPVENTNIEHIRDVYDLKRTEAKQEWLKAKTEVADAEKALAVAKANLMHAEAKLMKKRDQIMKDQEKETSEALAQLVDKEKDIVRGICVELFTTMRQEGYIFNAEKDELETLRMSGQTKAAMQRKINDLEYMVAEQKIIIANQTKRKTKKGDGKA